MGARFVAAIVGVIILVVLAQTFVFSGDDGAPSLDRPGSIPTATPPAELEDPLLLGQDDGAGGGNGSSGGGATTTYTVQSGDTLAGIAAELGVSADAQAEWIGQVLELNGMQDARELQAGQELTLPAGSATASGPAETAGEDTVEDEPDEESDEASEPISSPIVSATGSVPTPTPSGGAADGVYVVQDGDYPYLIATNHCVDDPDAWSQELLALNGAEATSLSPGQELELPPGTPAFCGEAGSIDDDGEDQG